MQVFAAAWSQYNVRRVIVSYAFIQNLTDLTVCKDIVCTENWRHAGALILECRVCKSLSVIMLRYRLLRRWFEQIFVYFVTAF
jgi:hypothetical protein